MTRVEILLSTHDGLRYLEPLLASLRAQTHPGVSLLVRDDGSRDGTPALLAAEARAGALRVIAGANVGPAASFFELLAAASDDAELYAFCDQDDVWLPDKVARAVAVLGAHGRSPALYCGRQILVGPALEPLGLSRVPRRGPSFENALVENVATGCTVVLDRGARERLLVERPRSIVMHDWWAYLVVSALGETVYDPEPMVLYRQHGANVIGTTTSSRGRWRARLARWRRHGQRQALVEQAAELERIHGAALSSARRRVLERFLARRTSTLAALRYALAPDVYRQGRFDHAVLVALLGLRRI